MTILELWIYTTLIPGVGFTLTFITLLGGVGLLAATFVAAALRDTSRVCPDLDSSKREGAQAETLFALIKKSIIPFIILMTLSAVTPSEKQMLLIAGGYTATNNEDMQKIPSNAAKAVNAWLEAVTDIEIEETK